MDGGESSALRERGDRRAVAAILGLSVAILAFLFWLIYFQEPPATASTGPASRLPAFNALCNGISATCVVAGLLFIYRGRRTAHALAMMGATLASVLFLAGYIAYHNAHGDTQFVRQDWVRPVYFSILITHIVLSMLVVPLILGTLWFAARRRWSVHRRLARWTYPVWLYVSVTGVIIFWMLRTLNG